MENNKDYKEINRKSWNQRTDIHIGSDFYNNESFIKGRNSLNSIEIDLLGDIKEKSILHLQCHFGQDTISLNRLGAKSTGVDLSDKSIERAKELASTAKSDSTFICSDIYELPNNLDEKFDIVYTGYGAICWLPDLDKWANIISKFLKPNGKFVIVEFHPVIGMLNDDSTKIKYSYFNTGPIAETIEDTYTDNNTSINFEDVTWNHGISEVINSLIKNGLTIDSFDEFDYSCYNCFSNMEEIAPNKFRFKAFGNQVPMLYSIVATKNKNNS